MSSISPGARLGPYELVAPIGAGGMGEVWRGRDTRLDRSVAIKILPAEFAHNSRLRLRFEREARVISQLNHPHICTLYDVGDSFLVMELLEGESLAERIARGPLPIPETIKYGVQIAEALARAHRAGIVHRDLKPGNVMITRSGAKLLDFGLAKSGVATSVSEGPGPMVGAPPAPPGLTFGATAAKPLTQEGTILGTFQYMAPEQLEGEEADARTDIFALGALLYEMATGRRAFDGKTRTSLIASIVSAQPQPISELQPLTPPPFEHVVQKCLAKDRDSRWQSAWDVAEQLRWIGEAGSQAGVAAPVILRRKWRERLAWIAGIVVAIAAGIGLTRAFHLFQPPRPRYSLTVPTVDAEYRAAPGAQISPDGQSIYFVGGRGDNPTRFLFRRRLDDFRAVPVEGAEGTGSFIITPDSRKVILGFSGGVLKRISVDGGPVENVAVVQAAAPTGVAPDGTILAGSLSLDRPLRAIRPDGTVEQALPLDKAHGETGQLLPAFLPARRYVLSAHWPFLVRETPRYLFLSAARDATSGTARFTLCAASLGSKEVRRIGEVPSRVQYADGHLFYVREGTLMAQPFDPDALAFTGEARPVLNEVPFSSRSGVAWFSVSSDGTVVCGRSAKPSRLTWVDSTGKKLASIGSPFSLTSGIGGTRLALTRQSDRVILGINDARAGTSSLWSQGLTRETSARVTFSRASETSPVVTADGSRVFFTSDALSSADIFEAPVDGSAPPKLVLSEVNLQAPTDISPDGRFLLYTTNQNQTATRQDLWILPLTGERKPYPFLATPASESGGLFSPDGKWIAYVSDLTGSTQVYVRPFPGPGAARPVSIKGGTAPRFSPDGRRIYFIHRSTLFAADFHDGTVGEPKPLFELAERIGAYEVVGDRFLMVLVDELESAPPLRVIAGWRP